MSQAWIAAGLALNSAAWIAALYRGNARRSRRERHEVAAGRRFASGPRVALAGALVQLVAGMLLLGWLEALAIVLAAWMALGAAFVPWVSSNPERALAGARLLGALGALLLAGACMGGAF
jgi:hypothetical protein